MRMTEKQIQATAHEIAVIVSAVQCDTLDPPGWEFDRVTYLLANYFRRVLPGFDMAAFRATCNIYSTPVEEYEEEMATGVLPYPDQ